MRASFLIAAVVAVGFALPAIADPAYTSDKVVDFFAKSKAAQIGRDPQNLL